MIQQDKRVCDYILLLCARALKNDFTACDWLPEVRQELRQNTRDLSFFLRKRRTMVMNAARL